MGGICVSLGDDFAGSSLVDSASMCPRSLSSTSSPEGAIPAVGEPTGEDDAGRCVQFSDVEGRPCMMRMNSQRKLDLYIHGRQKVANVSDLRADEDVLHFGGTKLFFSGSSIKVAGTSDDLMMKIWAMKSENAEDKTLESLQNGTLRILSAAWLLQMPSDYILQRCQDLPDAAFLSPDVAAELYRRPLGLVVVSYPWLSRQHPDPTGFHLRLFRVYLEKHVSYLVTADTQDFGVFWDYATIPQRGLNGELSEGERRRQKAGMAAVNKLYGSPDTVKVLLKSMPDCSCDKLNLMPYDQRGWCLFEATVASLVTPAHRLLDLGLETARAILDKDGSEWPEIQKAATAQRKPPLHPAIMKAELGVTSFTKGHVDRALVEEKYEEFFYQVVPFAKVFLLTNFSDTSGWNDCNMKNFSLALPAFSRLSFLRMSNHNFSDDGLFAVLKQLVKLENLQALVLHRCKGFSGSAFQALEGGQMPAMKLLALDESAMTDAGLSALAEQLNCFVNLQQLTIAGCRSVGPLGISALARCVPASLHELHFGRSTINDDNMHGLAENLPLLPNLRRLDFRDCKGLGAHGLAALTSCLPRLPAMAGLEENAICECGCRLEKGEPPFMKICARCRYPIKAGDLCYPCTGCSKTLCATCPFGSLRLPGHIKETPEAEALVEAWTAGGRAAQQINWTC